MKYGINLLYLFICGQTDPCMHRIHHHCQQNKCCEMRLKLAPPKMEGKKSVVGLCVFFARQNQFLGALTTRGVGSGRSGILEKGEYRRSCRKARSESRRKEKIAECGRTGTELGKAIFQVFVQIWRKKISSQKS